jgi:hypothetical protein
MIELKRFGCSPNGYPFAPLVNIGEGRWHQGLRRQALLIEHATKD